MNDGNEQNSPETARKKLREAAIACLGVAPGGRPAGENLTAADEPASAVLPAPSRPEDVAAAPLPGSPEAKGAEGILSRVYRVAAVTADITARHLDHLVEHLEAIGCISKADVESLFRWERRTLASLYLQAAKPRPSPDELTRLALRYALDARRPIAGDLGRFQVHPSEHGWKIAECPSAAMRLMGSLCPGRTIRNIFAVRILERLQARPPDLYGLMGLIETMLGGVPSPADGLAGAGPDVPGPQPKMEVDLQRSIVWLDGEPIPVKPEQAYFMQGLLTAKGGWLSSTEMAKSEKSKVMIGPRPDRVFKRLPKALRDLIDSAGGRGFRLRLA